MAGMLVEYSRVCRSVWYGMYLLLGGSISSPAGLKAFNSTLVFKDMGCVLEPITFTRGASDGGWGGEAGARLEQEQRMPSR